MKFGKTLRQNQVSEWSVYYLNYKNLKQIIKLGLLNNLDHKVIIDSFVMQLNIEQVCTKQKGRSCRCLSSLFVVMSDIGKL